MAARRSGNGSVGWRYIVYTSSTTVLSEYSLYRYSAFITHISDLILHACVMVICTTGILLLNFIQRLPVYHTGITHIISNMSTALEECILWPKISA